MLGATLENGRNLAASAAAECGLNFQDLDIDWSFVLGTMAVLVAATMAIEMLIHYVEARLEEHAHYMSLLRKVYKELVILGLLATALMLVRQFSHYNHDEFMMIEFTHLWLFSVGACLVGQSILIMKLTRNVKMEWDRQLLEGTKGILRRYDEHQHKYPVRPKYLRYLIGKHSIREGMELFLYRDLMVKSFRLPQHFDFTKYLRRSLSVSIVHDVEIGIPAWFLLMVILCISFLSITFREDKLEPELARLITFWIAVGLGWVMLITSVFVNAAMERGRDRLLREAGCSNLSFLDNDLRVLTQSLNDKVSKAIFQISSSSSKVAKRVIDIDVLYQQAINRNKMLKHVYPFHRPEFLKQVFDMILLTQTFTIGLVLIGALAGFGASVKSGLIIPMWATLIVGLLPHTIMATFFFPHIIRTMTVLNAMCKVDRNKLRIVQDVLILQETTHSMYVRFSRFLCDTIVELVVQYFTNGMSFPQESMRTRSRTSSLVALTRPMRASSETRMETSEIAKMALVIPEFRKRIIDAMNVKEEEENAEEVAKDVELAIEASARQLFKLLDNNGTMVSVSSLVNTISTEPYNFRINQKQAMYLFRSLGFHHGFNIQQFVTVVNGAFSEQIQARKKKITKLDLCFGHLQEVRCNICDKPVDLKELKKHSIGCAPEDLTIDDKLKVTIEEESPKNMSIEKRMSRVSIEPEKAATRTNGDKSKIVPMTLEPSSGLVEDSPAFSSDQTLPVDSNPSALPSVEGGERVETPQTEQVSDPSPREAQGDEETANALPDTSSELESTEVSIDMDMSEASESNDGHKSPE